MIVGGGFAGLTCAFALAKKEQDRIDIIIVDKSDTHTYTPWLYDIATSFLVDAHAKQLHALERIGAFSIAQLVAISGYKHLRFKKAELDIVHKEEKHLIFKDGKTLRYDYLVVAIGAQTNYFRIEGMEEFSLPLKTLQDGLRIRGHLKDLLMHVKKHNSMRGRVLIIGGGPTGVETATELANFLSVCKQKGLDYCKRIELTLLDAGPNLLQGLHPFLGRDAEKRLKKLGVNVRKQTLVKSVDAKSVQLVQNNKAEVAQYDLLIWAGGVASHAIASRFPFARDERHRIKTEKTLMVMGEKDVFALGDCMNYFDEVQQKSLPPTAWVAVDVGKVAARNIYALIHGKPLIHYLPPKTWPAIITLGGRRAIGGGFGFYLQNTSAFILRRLVDLRYFFGIMPKFMALRIWTRAILTLSHND